MAHVSNAVGSPSLEVANLTLKSGKRTVLADVSFTAATGSLVWITGENGAGKSSLLRVLAVRSNATGKVRFMPVPSISDITFYSPLMGVPAHTTVAEWCDFNQSLFRESRLALPDDDPLLPAVHPKVLMSALSTGEAKRLLLWSLLRLKQPFTFLDEPYEHLSPSAKSRLTEILVARARDGVVVVATNQDVPPGSAMSVLNLS